MAVAPKSQLGPYQILAPLGAGGMGEVWRARDSRIGREVAIKVLPPDLAADPERLKRFEHEARAAGALNHPNLLTLFDLGTQDGQPYLVTELLEGETLRARLDAGPLPLKRVLDFAVQIARGLAAAHQGGIVHRDLKPENLFVAKDGQIKILDFGLARLEREEPPPGALASATLTQSGVILGTAGYMSPEQVRGERADARSDLFAFGCVVYEMLAGRRAFAGDTAIQTMSAILSSEPPPLSALRAEIPEPLARLVAGCLEKDREQRFQSARDVALALGAIGSGTVAVPATPARRNRAALIVVVGVAALALASAGWLALRGRNVPPPTYQRLTFRRGNVTSARFAPDGQTIVYSAAWDGEPLRLYTTRQDSHGSTALTLPDARLLSVSSSSEIALALGPGFSFATGIHTTLARAALAGGAPRELLENVAEADWSPDGQSLAVLRVLPDRTRLEYPIGKVLVESGVGFIGLRVSPRGDRVAFIELDTRSDFTRGRVAVVDRSGRVVRLTPVWGAIQGLAWSPRGDEIWYTATLLRGVAKQLRAVTLSGRQRLVLSAPGGLTLHDVFRDGRVLVSQDNFRVSTLALAPGGTQERDLSWLEATSVADLSSDGRTLVFTDYSEAFGASYTIGMRGTDGSPVVRLGDGYAGGLSPDGKWVVAILLTPRPHLSLLPTGAGENRDLDPGPITGFDWSFWSPDGQHVLFGGSEGRHAFRAYIQDVAGGPPHPVTPEGIGGGWHQVSPDGRFLIGGERDSVYLFPLNGGEPRRLPWVKADDGIICWLPDGHSLLVRAHWAPFPAHIERLDLSSGERRFVRDLMPADPAGLVGVMQVLFTPDTRAYAYSCSRILSDLYVVEGLR